MKKGKIAIAAIGCVALITAIGFAGWKGYVRQESEKYNLITIDTSSLPDPIENPSYEGYVTLSEVTMHYAVYGEEGHPLILVHGNGGNMDSLKEAAQYLANDYKVYVIESRCHGKSSDPGEISYDLMAKDIKEFIEKTELEKPYLMGHSDGGINALTVAYTYPELLGGFISCGANTVPDTFKPYFTIGVKVLNIFKPDKLNDMMLTLPQMNKELLSKIKCPSYIVAGENDIMWLSDTVLIYESIKDSKVSIIKNADHSSYISKDGKQAYILAKDFFDSIK